MRSKVNVQDNILSQCNNKRMSTCECRTANSCVEWLWIIMRSDNESFLCRTCAYAPQWLMNIESDTTKLGYN